MEKCVLIHHSDSLGSFMFTPYKIYPCSDLLIYLANIDIAMVDIYFGEPEKLNFFIITVCHFGGK